jgi:iron complex outermembrane recepter protein
MKAISMLMLFVLLIPGFVLGQDQVVKTYQSAPVVITGSRQPESPGNVTQKIDVVSDSTIQRLILPNRNIAEAIQSQPGSSVNTLSRNDANWGTYSGIGPKYSTFMLQGLPIDAFIDPMALDLSAIARIEVQRGPASVLYSNYLSQDFAGNQSPLSGTVNLILKERIENQQTQVSTSLGSYRTLNGQIYHQDKAKNLNYFVGASYEKSDYTDYGIKDSWLHMTKDPQYLKTKLYGGAALYFGDEDNQKFTLFANKTLHSGDAGRVYRGYDNDYGMLNAGYSIAFNDKINLQTHFGLRSYDRTWQESTTTLPDTLQSNNGVYQSIIPIDVVLSIKHGADNNLVLGVDYQDAQYYTWSDPLHGYQTYGNKSRAKQAGIFSQEEYRIDAFTLRGGLRYSFMENKIDLIDGGVPGLRSQDWSTFIWSAGIRYNFNDQAALYANGGNSFIPPGLKSIGGTIKLSDRGVIGKNGQLPNPDLKPESGTGIDIGTDISLLSDITVGLRGFATIIQDAIIDNAVSQTPSQTQSINAGKSTSTGIEIEFGQRLCDVIRWFANYTYLSTKIKNSHNTDQDGTNVPFAPDNLANIGVDVTLSGGLQVHPTLNYGGKYYDSNSKSGRNSFMQGTVLNITASQLLVKGNGYATEIFIQLYNITDHKYIMPWGFQNPGFSASGGIRVTL